MKRAIINEKTNLPKRANPREKTLIRKRAVHTKKPNYVEASHIHEEIQAK